MEKFNWAHFTSNRCVMDFILYISVQVRSWVINFIATILWSSRKIIWLQWKFFLFGADRLESHSNWNPEVSFLVTSPATSGKLTYFPHWVMFSPSTLVFLVTVKHLTGCHAPTAIRYSWCTLQSSGCRPIFHRLLWVRARSQLTSSFGGGGKSIFIVTVFLHSKDDLMLTYPTEPRWCKGKTQRLLTRCCWAKCRWWWRVT